MKIIITVFIIIAAVWLSIGKDYDLPSVIGAACGCILSVWAFAPDYNKPIDNPKPPNRVKVKEVTFSEN